MLIHLVNTTSSVWVPISGCGELICFSLGYGFWSHDTRCYLYIKCSAVISTLRKVVRLFLRADDRILGRTSHRWPCCWPNLNLLFPETWKASLGRKMNAHSKIILQDMNEFVREVEAEGHLVTSYFNEMNDLGSEINESDWLNWMLQTNILVK